MCYGFGSRGCSLNAWGLGLGKLSNDSHSSSTTSAAELEAYFGWDRVVVSPQFRFCENCSSAKFWVLPQACGFPALVLSKIDPLHHHVELYFEWGNFILAPQARFRSFYWYFVGLVIKTWGLRELGCPGSFGIGIYYSHFGPCHAFCAVHRGSHGLHRQWEWRSTLNHFSPKSFPISRLAWHAASIELSLIEAPPGSSWSYHAALWGSGPSCRLWPAVCKALRLAFLQNPYQECSFWI